MPRDINDKPASQHSDNRNTNYHASWFMKKDNRSASTCTIPQGTSRHEPSRPFPSADPNRTTNREFNKWPRDGGSGKKYSN